MSAACLPFLPTEARAGDTRTGERSAARQACFQGGLLVLALATGYALRFHGPAILRPFFQPLVLRSAADFALLLAAVVAAVVLHESGHLLVALALRFQYMGSSLGPLRLQLLHRKWKLTLSPRSLFSASVSAAPRQLNQWRGRMMAVVIAGPMATALAAAAAFYLLFHKADFASLETFATYSVQVNVLLFVIGLVPNGAAASTRNDARLFLILAGSGPHSNEMEITVRLTVLSLDGVRPQDYPRPLMLDAAKWRGRREGELAFAQVLVRWAVDCDEPAVAEAWDARALALSDDCDRRARNHALASSACMDVLFRNDLESARAKFSRVDTGALFPKCFEYRTRAARQIAFGRSYRASAEIIRAQYALPRGVPAYDMERRLLEILHMRALMRPTARALSRAAFAGR